MKYVIIAGIVVSVIAMAFSIMLLVSCKGKNVTDVTDTLESPDSTDDTEKAEETFEVTFKNEVVKADIWILPETEENRGTTLWGTATVGGLEAGAAGLAKIAVADGVDKYMLRVIDKDGMYYEVNGVSLAEGYTLTFRAGDDGPMDFALDVYDADGAIVKTYSAFAAML